MSHHRWWLFFGPTKYLGILNIYGIGATRRTEVLSNQSYNSDKFLGYVDCKFLPLVRGHNKRFC